MFTGIVEELGRIVRVPSPGRAGQLEIAATRVLAGTNVGDSIAVNGVCLTATTVSATGFTADVMPQTLAHSNLGALRAGSPVNLERAMAADGRFGGHIVSGHIDGTGTIRRIRRDQNAVRFAIERPASIMALIVQRGSVAHRRHQPDGGRACRRRVRGVHHPPHHRADNAFAPQTRRCGEPGKRRGRQIRSTIVARSLYNANRTRSSECVRFPFAAFPLLSFRTRLLAFPT